VSTLYIVRHGETEWNVAGRVQGHGDSPLTARGEAQARTNGALLAARGGVGALWVSPLGRTRQTAALLLEQHPHPQPQVTFEAALMERHSGAWEGLTGAEIARRDPGHWAVRKKDMYHHRPPGGENHVDLEQRIAPLLARLRAYLDADGAESPISIALVTHGILGRVLLKCLLDLTPSEAVRVLQPNHLVYGLRPVSTPAETARADGWARLGRFAVGHFLDGQGPMPGLLRH